MLDIVGAVFAAHPDDAWQVSDEVADFLADARPRSSRSQYRESDYRFVTRPLSEEGLGFCFVEDAAAPADHSRRALQW